MGPTFKGLCLLLPIIGRTQMQWVRVFKSAPYHHSPTCPPLYSTNGSSAFINFIVNHFIHFSLINLSFATRASVMNPVLGNKKILLSSPTKVYWQDKKKKKFWNIHCLKSNDRKIKSTQTFTQACMGPGSTGHGTVQ